MVRASELLVLTRYRTDWTGLCGCGVTFTLWWWWGLYAAPPPATRSRPGRESELSWSSRRWRNGGVVSPWPGLGTRPGLGLGLGLRTGNMEGLSFGSHDFTDGGFHPPPTWGWVQRGTSWCCLVYWWCWCWGRWSGRPAGRARTTPRSGCCRRSGPRRCPAPGCLTAGEPGSAEGGGAQVALGPHCLLALLPPPPRPPPHPHHPPLHPRVLPPGRGGNNQRCEAGGGSRKRLEGWAGSFDSPGSAPHPPPDQQGFHSGAT